MKFRDDKNTKLAKPSILYRYLKSNTFIRNILLSIVFSELLYTAD